MIIFIITDFPRFNVTLCFCAGVSLAVCVAVTERVLDVKSVVGADCTLPCTAELEPGVQYVAVRWYKVRLKVFSVCGLNLTSEPRVRIHRTTL